MIRWLKNGCRYGLALCALLACNGRPNKPDPKASKQGPEQQSASPVSRDPLRDRRHEMVQAQLEARGITDSGVLAAMRDVPRHLFVPEGLRARAYDDTPLPIEANQTISQPYIVALMTELAGIAPGDRVLEVGTGSGYQAAVLAEMGADVYSIEIVEELAKTAEQRLDELDYRVHVKHGDGYAGWPEHAPFDAILLTAAPPEIPEPLKRQLAVGGRLIAPVGRGYQDLVMLTRTETGYKQHGLIPVRFVPMTGEAQGDENP